MTAFQYHNSSLRCEGVAISEVAEVVPTPFYLYSKAAIHANLDAISTAFGDVNPLICYALKANSNPHLLRLLSACGIGADVVSGGEIYLALENGFPADKIVFAGVGKTDAEIEYALSRNVYTLNVESLQEVGVIEEIARRLGQQARVGLRINPDIDVEGHPYISTGKASNKFGISLEEFDALVERLPSYSNIKVVGLHIHTGSMIDRSQPYLAAIECMRRLKHKLEAAGAKLDYVDIGGGLSVDYHAPLESPAERIHAIISPLAAELRRFDCRIIFEPGRSLVASAGILVTRVLYTKHTGDKHFVIADAGMSDLLRPSLYSAHHEILPVCPNDRPLRHVDVVGPVCESGDFLAKDRLLPEVERGDLLAVMTAGAYGFVLSSNYNSRPRPAEVLVNASDHKVIRERGTWSDLQREVTDSRENS